MTSDHGHPQRSARLADIDAALRTWPGVAFAILALELGLHECLLRARAVTLGLIEQQGRPV